MIYLHIGMPKTGSSAIQAFLILNHEVLKKGGILFPDPPNFDQPFQTTAGNAAKLSELLIKNELDSVHKFIKSFYAHQVLILSSESLFHVIRMYPERFFNVFNHYNYKVICYVRRQDNLFSSCYNQLVKSHDVTSDSIIEQIMKTHNYCEVLLGCLKYADPGKFIIRPYENQQFYGGNIYSDFMNCLGLELDASYVLPNETVNPSLDRDTLEFRRILNELGVDRNNIKHKYLINSLLGRYTIDHHGGRPFQEQNIFSPEERVRIIQLYEEENKKIAKLFLGREDGQLFYDPLPDVNQEWQPRKSLTIEKVLDICKYILETQFKDKFEEELIKGIAKGTVERVLRQNEVNEKDFEKEPLIYILKSQPIHLSKDVAALEKKEDCWYIESCGEDPYFSFPDFNEENNGKVSVKIVITASTETELQLFYIADNKVFDEEHSISKKIKRGYNQIIVKINESCPIKAMRLDPGKSKGIYLLHVFEVRGQKLH